MRCPVHHKEKLNLGGTPVCTACLAGGSASANAMMESMRVRSAELQLRRRLNEADVPPAFLDAGFDNFVAQTPQAESIAKVLNQYCQNFSAQRAVRPGFIFTGNPGTGKTHLACAMVHALSMDGFTAVYASLPRFTKELRAAYGKTGAVEELIQRLIDADFLALDEIDLHGQSDTDYNTLYDIVNSRYESEGRPTLALSNRPLERLRTDLDERVVSRILGGSKPIVFDWPSRREMRVSQRRAPAAGARKVVR
jgi:DNA replication protein DnaC